MKRLFLLPFVTLVACQGATADPIEKLSTERGKALYEQSCESCHGAGLSGGQAPSLADDVWEYDGTDAGILQAITDGIEDVGMPGFGDELTPENKADLIAYIRSGGDLKTTVPIDDVPSVEDQVQIEDWATGFDQPWGLHFIGPDTALVTEKSGKLLQVTSSTRFEVLGIPASVNDRQGGLMDVATCLLYTSPSPRDQRGSRMPSSA